MENKDVELGDVGIIQESISSILNECVKNQNQGRFTQSIYYAPRSLRRLSPNSFNPRVVSIGPMHKDEHNVVGFEEQKAKCVHDMLIRLKAPLDQTLEECVKKVAFSIDEIKGCYVGLKKSFTDVQLVKMMVMDACFILEFIYQKSRRDEQNAVNLLLAGSICYDLVLLENQIPFFVLKDMYECPSLKFDQRVSLVDFILPVLEYIDIFEANLRVGEINKTRPILHILSLLHICYQPQSNALSYYPSSTMDSAAELDRGGVNFKPNKDAKWPMEVLVKVSRYPWSWGKPTIMMPIMRINHFTASVLRNLIAYEISSTDYNYVTLYAVTMDMLIDTPEDVAKLVKSKVLVNNMGSNEEAANIMNMICKEVASGNFIPDAQWEKVDNYCKSYWPKNIERLRRNYFNSPWTLIALVAGIFLFALTVIQTVFAIKPPGSNE